MTSQPGGPARRGPRSEIRPTGTGSARRRYSPGWKLLGLLAPFLLIGLGGCQAQPAENRPTAALAVTLPPLAGSPTSATLRYAIFPAPPYMIGADQETAQVSGIDVDIMQAIAGRLNLKVEYIKCTWARCLELMKSGQADVLSSAYKKPDREVYMDYLDAPYLDQLPIAFYYLKGKGYTVANYEDIYQFHSVGVLHAASYFPRFDDDPAVQKIEVPSQDQLFPMLLAGRVDAIAGYVPTENYHLMVEGYQAQVERSAYEYTLPAFVYMTVSKKSPLVARLGEVNQINRQLLDTGFIAKIVNSYYATYR
jgi:polar amino acid transport system substrate-binding protein